MFRHTVDFYRSILDSVTEHIVIIDGQGLIQFVNAAWISFGEANMCAISSDWRGINYLDVCDLSASRGEKHAKIVAAGTRKIMHQKCGVFYHEYPCHSPTEKRWFMMRVTPLEWEGSPCFVISHHNITERKLAEEKVKILSIVDELTGVANRRHFDDFLSKEWRRATRTHSPLSLILLDVDYFKLFNDRYGHQAGDECLQRIAKVLKSYGRRSSDLPARYGGEEFGLILGNTDAEASVQLASDLLNSIRGLKIYHGDSNVSPVVTASIGVATVYPQKGRSEKMLVKCADHALYRAKRNGRNRVSVSEDPAALANEERDGRFITDVYAPLKD